MPYAAKRNATPEATGMREKTRDGGREGKACMCAKVARESMLPIMRMRGDGGDANPGRFPTWETRAETSERGLPTSVWGWFQHPPPV